MYLWFENVWDRGDLPLLVCFAAFVVTFITTRAITRMIRSGRGPFKNNVSASGVHVHHAVPGVFLLVVGAFTAIVVDLDSPWSIVAGLFVGIGTSLLLDEFALILHLEDVYWTDKGRISVEIASLAVACLGLMLIGANPLGILDEEDQNVTVIGVVVTITLHLAFILICLLKGKYRIAAAWDLHPAAGIDRCDPARPADITLGAALVLAEKAGPCPSAGSQARRPVGTDHEGGRLRRCRQADRTRIQGATDRHRETTVVRWMMVEGRRLSQLGISSSRGSIRPPFNRAVTSAWRPASRCRTRRPPAADNASAISRSDARCVRSTSAPDRARHNDTPASRWIAWCLAANERDDDSGIRPGSAVGAHDANLLAAALTGSSGSPQGRSPHRTAAPNDNTESRADASRRPPRTACALSSPAPSASASDHSTAAHRE